MSAPGRPDRQTSVPARKGTDPPRVRAGRGSAHPVAKAAPLGVGVRSEVPTTWKRSVVEVALVARRPVRKLAPDTPEAIRRGSPQFTSRQDVAGLGGRHQGGIGTRPPVSPPLAPLTTRLWAGSPSPGSIKDDGVIFVRGSHDLMMGRAGGRHRQHRCLRKARGPLGCQAGNRVPGLRGKPVDTDRIPG
jgi:hypothetical protein